MFLTFCLVTITVLVHASGVKGHGTFNYDRNDIQYGPYAWKHIDSSYTCDGTAQSPINILPETVVYGQNERITFSYQNAEQYGTLLNNGHSAKFLVIDPDYTLTGVPFNTGDTFELKQLHFHFGKDDLVGSEHTFNDSAYSGEAHLVHFNKKYENMSEAIKHPDGLAVVGVFIVAFDTVVPSEIDEILQDNLPSIVQTGEEVNVTLSPITLVPEASAFYFYNGSLTTPPCSEVVTWMVYRDPIFLAVDTFRLLRELKTAVGDPMGEHGNFRPVQSSVGREVYANFNLH